MDPKEVDRHAGEVIRRLRTEKGWSQSDLAEAMTAEGVPMHALTVLKIEKGTRPMRLAEVQAALTLLEGSWDELDPPTSLEDLLYEADDELGEELKQLRAALLRFIKAWNHIKDTVETYAPYVDDVRVRGLKSFDDLVGSDKDGYLGAIVRQVVYAEEDWRRDPLLHHEEAEAWLGRLEARRAEVMAELSTVQLDEGNHGEHPEAPER